MKKTNSPVKDVAYYKAQSKLSLDKAQWQELYDEVVIILAGMDKGLNMLKQMNRAPEKKVLENQKDFLQLKDIFKKHL